MDEEEELAILRHALGLNEDGTGRAYRNYYAAEPNDKDCATLEQKGDMRSSSRTPLQGELKYYYVTGQGIKRARKQ